METANCLPSGDNFTLGFWEISILVLLSCLPAVVSQILMASPPADTTIPGCSIRTPVTFSVWPVSVRMAEPVVASQILTDLSLPPDRMVRPSGVKLQNETWSECPFRTVCSIPDSTFQTLRVLSQLPVTIRWPSGEKARHSRASD